MSEKNISKTKEPKTKVKPKKKASEKKKPVKRTSKKRAVSLKKASARRRRKSSKSAFAFLKVLLKTLINFLMQSRVALFVGGGLAVFFVAMLFAPRVKVANGFTTFKELKSYVIQFNELEIKMENANIIKPNYTTHYRNLKKGFFSERLHRLATFLHLQDKPIWTVETFQDLAKKIVKRAEAKKLTGYFLHKIVATSKTKIVAWGDLQGAFHSLVRDLEQLKKLSIIDEDLKVTNGDYYLIFLGDVVSRSPFILETLSTVMQLVWKNPDNVFYLRGNHEAHDYWQGYGLKRELKLRAGHLKTVDDKIPLRPLVRKFFKTLPIVMYFAMPHDDDREFVRFSHEGGNEFKVVELDESKYDDFLQQPSHGKIGTFHMEGLEADNSRLIELQAIIRAEVKRKSYQANDGLRLIAPEEGVTSWTLLSCPTEVYRKGLKFYNDAFGLIEAAQNEKDWKITLYKQDIRTRDGFKLRSHYLLSGSEVDKGDRSERLLATFKARQKEIQKTGMSHGEDEITFVSKEPDFGKKPVPVTKAAVSKLDNKRKIGQATIFSGAESKVFDIAMKCRIISEKAKEKELNLECQVVTPPSRKRAVPRPPRLERRVRRSIGGYTSRVEELPSQFMPPHRPGRQTALNKRVKAPEPPPAPSSIRSMSPTVERLQRQQTRPTRKEMVIEEFNGVLEEQLPDKPIVEPEKIPLAVDI